jgi:hypothetical protein
MFTKSGIIELHATMHERLDLLLRHVATVLDNRLPNTQLKRPFCRWYFRLKRMGPSHQVRAKPPREDGRWANKTPFEKGAEKGTKTCPFAPSLVSMKSA